MHTAEMIKQALAIQSDIDARIAEGLIPDRYEGAAFAMWFDTYVGCSRCRYGVRQRGSVCCSSCAIPTAEEFAREVALGIPEFRETHERLIGPLPPVKKGRKAREIE